MTALAEPDLLTIHETARRLHVHPDTLYRWARDGDFPPAIKIGRGRRWMVSVPRLERYLHGETAAAMAEYSAQA